MILLDGDLIFGFASVFLVDTPNQVLDWWCFFDLAVDFIWITEYFRGYRKPPTLPTEFASRSMRSDRSNIWSHRGESVANRLPEGLWNLRRTILRQLSAVS